MREVNTVAQTEAVGGRLRKGLRDMSVLSLVCGRVTSLSSHSGLRRIILDEPVTMLPFMKPPGTGTFHNDEGEQGSEADH